MEHKFTSPTWTELFRHLYFRKISLFLIPIIVTVIVVLISYLIPNRYTSVANLLPSQQPNIGFDLFSEGGGLSSIASSVFGNGNSEEANRYSILLSSETTSRKVIDEFNLIEHYELTDSEVPYIDAIEILNERTSFLPKEEGNFIIRVESTDPRLSQDIAEFYIETLNSENIRIVSSDARLYRQFIEQRYETSLADLDSLRQEIVDFQNRYGVFELPTQAASYFELVAELTAKQIESEITVEILQNKFSTDNSLLKDAIARRNVIQNRLESVYNDTSNSNIILNFGELSEVGTQYYRLQLEAEIQTEIQKFIIPILEQAKMMEVKNLPLVSVVDQPSLPLKKSFPKRSVIAISALLTSFFVLLIFTLIQLLYNLNSEYLRQLTRE